ncbi:MULTISPECIES: C40 family peptidase [Pseudomonas]|uniref:NlpC/P60 family protein n=1 Tax=Pseudomonas segetis TaxID=298908 RepID=A0A238ZVD2_9PSED|nr:NlpC/P60 family protein [Pseudomonas segetis]
MRRSLLGILFCCSFGVLASFSAQATEKHLGAPKASLPKAAAVVSRAQELIGVPYRWGGTNVRRGFDCSGLIVYLFGSQANIHLPRTTAQMIKMKAPKVAKNDLRAGDVVFFNHNGRGRVSHMGLYIGEGRFIHAPRTGKTIRISKLGSGYWSRHYIGAKRFLNGDGSRDQPMLAVRKSSRDQPTLSHKAGFTRTVLSARKPSREQPLLASRSHLRHKR